MPDWETYQAAGTVRVRRRPVRYHAAKTNAKHELSPAPDAPDYSSMLKDELVAAAEERGLDSSGTKAELIERLES